MCRLTKKYIEKHFKDYTIGTIILFDDNEYNDTDMILYRDTFAGADNYFVELSNNNKTIVLQVGMDGLVSFFKGRLQVSDFIAGNL